MWRCHVISFMYIFKLITVQLTAWASYDAGSMILSVRKNTVYELNYDLVSDFVFV